MPARFGSFLSEPFSFDAAAYSIAANEAVLMDPQQRLLLESVAESLHSRMTVQSEGLVGVFIGISTPDYADMAKSYSMISSYSPTGRLQDTCLL